MIIYFSFCLLPDLNISVASVLHSVVVSTTVVIMYETVLFCNIQGPAMYGTFSGLASNSNPPIIVQVRFADGHRMPIELAQRDEPLRVFEVFQYKRVQGWQYFSDHLLRNALECMNGLPLKIPICMQRPNIG